MLMFPNQGRQKSVQRLSGTLEEQKDLLIPKCFLPPLKWQVTSRKCISPIDTLQARPSTISPKCDIPAACSRVDWKLDRRRTPSGQIAPPQDDSSVPQEVQHQPRQPLNRSLQPTIPNQHPSSPRRPQKQPLLTTLSDPTLAPGSPSHPTKYPFIPVKSRQAPRYQPSSRRPALPSPTTYPRR